MSLSKKHYIPNSRQITRLKRVRRALSHDLGPLSDCLWNPLREEVAKRVKNSSNEASSIAIVDFLNHQFWQKHFPHAYHFSALESDCLCYESLPEVEVLIVMFQFDWFESHDFLAAMKKKLCPEGRIHIVNFGSESLLELQKSWELVDDKTHIHSHLSLQDMGMLLQKKGFHLPVVDRENFILRYRDIKSLFFDLQTEGLSNASFLRRKTLTSKLRFAEFEKQLLSLKVNGYLNVTVEILFSTAVRRVTSNNSVRVLEPK